MFTDNPRATDANSNSLAGATWSFYATGTLTPQNVFANATLVTSLGAVVTADSGGLFVPIYLNAALVYRGILRTAGGATLRDIDPVSDSTLPDLAASSGSSLVGFTNAGSGALARTAQDKLRETISAADYDSLVNAIASAKVSGRPTTILINGTINVASTIVVDASNITLQGAGADTFHDIGAQGAKARTKFIWTGAADGTVVKFTSPEGASNQACSGGGMSDIYIDAGGVANIGLHVQTWRKGMFTQLHFNNPKFAGVYMNCVTTLGETRDNQNNEFRNISSRHFETPGGTGACIHLEGDATANTSLNYFENLDCQFLNGSAYFFGNSDNNYVCRLRAFRGGGGTGYAIEFNGSNVAAASTARNNIVVHLTVNGFIPIIMRGTTGFTFPSTTNSVLMIDYDNAYSPPSFEPGATGTWSDTRGLQAFFTAQTLGIGDDVVNSISAGSRVGPNGSLHIVNGAQNHMQLSDAANANRYGLSIDGSGNLRVLRLAGTGTLDLPTTLRVGAKAVTEGAADSGGVGFRVLRVPN
jgi:hypothetical protein